MTVLVIGYLLLSLLILTVVLGASAVYLDRQKLLSVADGAALTAADTFGLADPVPGATAPVPQLDAGTVRSTVQEYLDLTGAGTRFTGLAIDPATGAPDSRTARVVLTAVVHPPIVNFLVPEGIPIAVTADARSELTR
ncbi:pilus assembly protein TadG-related protein [Arthrobacter sp. H20]|uniref:pilus assembly protein TadG-related protein n=1 Tax=Arthrobacter sp. H20 TaxID=1267981 RepID=UPI00047A6263|nr:pilus assembly protein TadG-related protein [Arthrobacter sp. H20]